MIKMAKFSVIENHGSLIKSLIMVWNKDACNLNFHRRKMEKELSLSHLAASDSLTGPGYMSPTKWVKTFNHITIFFVPRLSIADRTGVIFRDAGCKTPFVTAEPGMWRLATFTSSLQTTNLPQTETEKKIIVSFSVSVHLISPPHLVGTIFMALWLEWR